MNKAVFLDRDGTITVDVDHCRRVEDLRIYDMAPKAIRLLNENGYKVIIITNQAGIGRRIFSEEMLECIHERLLDSLACFGAYIDGIYYCPHHPDDNCRCRKPKSFLFRKAIREHDIDIADSFMVGDTQTDIDAGNRIHCRTISIGISHNDADFYAKDIGDAVDWILKQQ